MLVLTRRPGQSLHIGDDIVVTVSSIKENQVKLEITAPDSIGIVRTEVIGKYTPEEIKEHRANRAKRRQAAKSAKSEEVSVGPVATAVMNLVTGKSK